MKVVSYRLHLDVDFQSSVVRGVNSITVVGVGGPLVLDAVGLEIGEVEMNGSRARYAADDRRGKLIIRGVPKRESLVKVEFTKRVTDESIFGLYKSKYADGHLLVTDLEPAQARTVFPCKDEPAFKAVFRLTVVTDPGLAAISNAEVRSKEETPDGRTKYTFEPTLPMSTYLFFFGVGRFEEAERRADGVRIIAATRPGMSKYTGYILDTAASVLGEFGKYYGIPYPLKKLHLVGLPEYNVGAMENWGAITSREAVLVVPPDASVSDHRRAAHTETHEIAHMWFGDLVTMEWWDDLWLNESFATFMDHKMTERLHPDWDAWTDCLRRHTFPSLDSDALSSTHTIQAHVRTVNEMHGIFDAISYGKGASVLRMLESYIGEEAFRRGVSAYLKKFSYSNASGKDLWASLSKASEKPVPRVARAWITRAGFPVLEAKESGGRLKLRQSRFRLTGKGEDRPWPIPVEISSGGKVTKMLLEKRSTSITLSGTETIIVNPLRKGFYSVIYDREMYDRLARDLQNLHPHDVAGLVNDLFLFMEADLVEPEEYFRFVSLSEGVHHPLVIMSISEQLTFLRAIAEESEIVGTACVRFSSSQLKEIGLTAREGEDENLSEAREVVSVLRARSDADFSRSLCETFADYESAPSDMVTSAAISHAVTHGERAYAQLEASMKGARGEVERRRLWPAITSFKDPGLVERAVELPVIGRLSRSDATPAIRGASENPFCRKTLWKWIEKRYDLAHDNYGGSPAFFALMNYAIPLCGVGLEKEVRSFISGRRYQEGRLTYNRTFELLQVTSRLRKKLLALGAQHSG